ncbi:MAG TPA: GIY-YIG nuclease family protein [Candidatus Saccharimonadales bacterium]|nr:GIY-YIG nuclease family protein [Candidatus Saccharimonadales bacterium]
MPKIMFVYIMANQSNEPTLYTGVTNNVLLRARQHKNEEKRGFTKKYHLHNLLYYEVIEGQEQAIIREKQIKNMSRKDKLEMIRQINPEFKDLYKRASEELF